MQASFIPSELLESVAEEVLPLLEKGAERSQGELSPESLLNLIYLGHMHLVCLFVDGELTLACVVQFQDRLSHRVAQIISLGGARLLLARKFFPWFCFWAALHECTAIEAWTRPQMTRALRRYGFQKKCDVVSFSLKGSLQ